MTSLRLLGPGFDPAVVAAIDAQLPRRRDEHHATVLLAVESGSRAWGFPSPDSDYDCRFIYVRRRDDYLALWPQRDVIEFPTDAVLDVNGWDLGKALRLLLKGNAVVIEWLTSPFVYAGDARFRDEALALARAGRAAGGARAALPASRRAPAAHALRRHEHGRVQAGVLCAAAGGGAALAAAASGRGGRADAFPDAGRRERAAGRRGRDRRRPARAQGGDARARRRARCRRRSAR